MRQSKRPRQYKQRNVLKHLNYGIDMIKKLPIELYDTGHISNSTFNALPKTPGATKFELHRTISLMSDITKILLRTIMMRVRNKIKSEIADGQCDFAEGKGTTNAIYSLRTIIERALEV